MTTDSVREWRAVVTTFGAKSDHLNVDDILVPIDLSVAAYEVLVRFGDDGEVSELEFHVMPKCRNCLPTPPYCRKCGHALEAGNAAT